MMREAGAEGQSSGRQGLLKVGWASGAMAFLVVHAFLLQVLLSRLLAPKQYGAFLLVSSIMLGATLMGLLGADKVIVRRVGEMLAREQDEAAGRLVRRALWDVARRGTAIGLVAGASVYFAGMWHLAPEAVGFGPVPALLLVIWIPANAVVLLTAEIFRGHHDIRSASIFATLPGALNLVALVVLLVSGHRSVKAAVLCTALPFALAAIAGVYALRYRGLLLRNSVSEGSVTPASSVSLASPAIAVVDLSAFLFGNLGIWLVAYLVGPGQVAGYGVATRMSTMIALPTMIANLVLPPMIVLLSTQRRTEQMEQTMRLSATLTFLPAAAMGVVFLVFGREVLSLAFGPFYASASTLLAILCIGQLLNVALGSCAYALVMTGQQKWVMLASILSSFVIIVSAPVLVLHYGALGMAVAASTGLVVQNVVNFAAVKRQLGIWTHVRMGFPRRTSSL